MSIIRPLVIATTVSFASLSHGELVTANTSASMTIPLYASVTGLGSIIMSTSDTGGSAGAVYAGSDSFALESNGQVTVQVTGSDLTDGSDVLSTSYILDGGSSSFDTTADSVHNASHTVNASATLGSVSAQKAGTYTSSLTITVSATSSGGEF